MSYIYYSGGVRYRRNDDGSSTRLSPESGSTPESRSAYAADIATARSQYDPLVRQQQQYNQQVEAGTAAEGLVSGRTRYASAVQTGVMAGVVSEGLTRVGEILSRKDAAIAQAGAARDKRDYETLQANLKAAEDAKKAAADEAQRQFENALATKKDVREQTSFEQEQLKTNAATVAGTIKGITDPAQKDAYISNYARNNNIDPQDLRGAITNFNDEKYKTIDSTMFSIAKDYPGIISDQDIVNHDIGSVLMKIENSETYKLDTQYKKAQIAKMLADALKAQNDADGGANGGASEALAFQIATTGKIPAGLNGLERDVNFEYAKKWAETNIKDGAIIEKSTGFLIPSADLSAANEQAVAASAGFLKAAVEITDFLKSKTTYPGGRTSAKAGQLIGLTDEETVKFNALRDNLTAAYVQSVSGVAVNEAEYKRLSTLIPNSNEWNKYSISKWDTFIDQAKRKTASTLEQRNATIKGVDLRTEQEIKNDIAKAKRDANLQSGQRLVQDAEGNLVVLDAGDELQPGDIEL